MRIEPHQWVGENRIEKESCKSKKVNQEPHILVSHHNALCLKKSHSCIVATPKPS